MASRETRCLFFQKGLWIKNWMRNRGIPSIIAETKEQIGHSPQTMHTSYEDMDMTIPRDCNGGYEPRLIEKYQ